MRSPTLFGKEMINDLKFENKSNENDESISFKFKFSIYLFLFFCSK